MSKSQAVLPKPQPAAKNQKPISGDEIKTPVRVTGRPDQAAPPKAAAKKASSKKAVAKKAVAKRRR